MKIVIAGVLALATVIMVGSNLTATDDSKSLSQSPELGQVNWNRDLDAAKKTSAQTKRPIFLLFQEVPG